MTDRHRHIARLRVMGLSHGQIAEAVGVSPKTSRNVIIRSDVRAYMVAYRAQVEQAAVVAAEKSFTATLQTAAGPHRRAARSGCSASAEAR